MERNERQQQHDGETTNECQKKEYGSLPYERAQIQSRICANRCDGDEAVMDRVNKSFAHLQLLNFQTFDMHESGVKYQDQ
jgi:hypothetical protein